MAVARVATTNDYAVSALLECLQDEAGVYTAGARYANDFYVCRVSQTARTCKVSTCIRTPVTAKRYDVRGKFFLFRGYILHIASTSDIICLELKPFRSIAPEGQVTVQAPQP